MKIPILLASAALALILAAVLARADSAGQSEGKFCAALLKGTDPLDWSRFLAVINNEILVPNRTEMMTSFATAHLAQIFQAWVAFSEPLTVALDERGASPRQIQTTNIAWLDCARSEMLAYQAVLDGPDTTHGMSELTESARLAHHAYRAAH